MSRGLRTLLVAVAILVVIAGLGYAAHIFDVAGMIARAHVPPPH
ncbi:MAG: hypothetical protein Q7T08_02995 [Devosia sp.]|nr:hypothetical protein [Devosia sp.]